MATDLFHIIDEQAWDSVRGKTDFEPESLRTEGFIHLSMKHQILRPANLLYRGRSDLHLLVLDQDALSSEVVFEPGSHGEEDLFPHLYGPLNLDAVTRTVAFPCEADGTFELPDGL